MNWKYEAIEKLKEYSAKKQSLKSAGLQPAVCNERGNDAAGIRYAEYPKCHG